MQKCEARVEGERRRENERKRDLYRKVKGETQKCKKKKNYFSRANEYFEFYR